MEAPAAGSDKPTLEKVALIELAGTETVRVVLTTPVLLVDVVVVVAAGAPVMTMAVRALIAGGGVVLEPAMVVPLGWPEAFPPASADWPHKPVATRIRGKAATRIARTKGCSFDFMLVQP